MIIPDVTPASTPIATPTIIPTTESTETQGKEVLFEPVQMKALAYVIPEVSKKEIEEILKIIKKSDYNVMEQLGKTPSKISMLALLLCSEYHA